MVLYGLSFFVLTTVIPLDLVHRLGLGSIHQLCGKTYNLSGPGPRFGIDEIYTVKKVSHFPVRRLDVTNQSLLGRE